jgi:phosphatidylglycerophosphate synthase
MNLHRTGKEPQWASVAPEDQNPFQKVAAKTGGLVAPANGVSLLGAGLVGSGLRDIAKGDTTKGVIKVGVGRIGGDLGDGFTADITGTKSPFGEGVDVVVDKGEAAVALPVLVKADILPKSAAGVIAAQNMANAAISAVAKRRGAEIHPSKEGKLTTFGQWTTIGLHGLAAVARENDAPKLAKGLEVAGRLSLVATAVLGAKAIVGYAGDALLPIPEAPPEDAMPGPSPQPAQ